MYDIGIHSCTYEISDFKQVVRYQDIGARNGQTEDRARAADNVPRDLGATTLTQTLKTNRWASLKCCGKYSLSSQSQRSALTNRQEQVHRCDDKSIDTVLNKPLLFLRRIYCHRLVRRFKITFNGPYSGSSAASNNHGPRTFITEICCFSFSTIDQIYT